ncbi:MAG: acyltransferase family protein [Prevotella sp.]|nr:acyltransferase family protein [Prevotella sp.]
MSRKERLEWLSLLRGLNILLVVLVHINLIDMNTGYNHKFCTNICFPFHPIRMPLFIFISGGLLYISRIRKNIPTKILYKDKCQRILAPFIFFIIIYFFIKVIFNQLAKTPAEISLKYLLESFVYYRGYSSQPLWFLAVLMILMLLYPLFCYLCNNKCRMLLFFIFCCAIYFINADLNSRWNIFYILELQHYLIFFFLGILFFSFKLYEYLKNIFVLTLLVLLYSLSYYFLLPLFTSIIGIFMMCALCLNVARYIPNLFSSFREYIFPIYLMSLPFQNFVELILWKHLFYNEHLFYVFYIINLIFGLFIPVLISKLVERCPVRLVRLCFGLK